MNSGFRISATLWIMLMIIVSGCQPRESTHSVTSPRGINTVHFNLDADGVPFYSVERKGVSVIEPSRMGFELAEGGSLSGNFRIQSVEYDSFDETWEQVWGEKRHVRNHYEEMTVRLAEEAPEGRELTVVFRTFDDGVGFRYEFPEQPNLDTLIIMDELTEFDLTGDHESWYVDAYQWNRFEYLFENTPLSQADTVHTPLTMRTADSLYISFHEAALVDFTTMTLERVDGYTLKANLMPWSDGVRVRGSAPMVTPWRTIQLADRPGDLITSYLILNLNEPNKIEDTSWIEPGKYVGIWWEMHLDKSTWGRGPNLGATTENAMRYIDFAAEHDIDHVLVEGWNPGWDGDWYDSGVVFDFTESIPEFDLEGVAQYALDRGTRLMGHHENSATVLHYESQMEEGFALYESLGVRAVKTGYVGHGREIMRYDEHGNEQFEWHHGQFMVDHHQRVVELAASHKISLNVHEGVKDTGLRRTWPNLMTREVAVGQEYNAWGEWGGNPPDYVVTLPFTRSLSGPFDYTPGIFELHFDEYRPDNRVKHTLAKELALYVTIFSPLQMAADLPQNYEANPEPFQFIKDVPVDWHDTKILHADIGRYVTIVRRDRNSDDWYLGSITDEQPRVLNADLSFLDSGRRYVAEIYRDGAAADWEENPYDIVIEEIEVDNNTMLPLELAPGGGQAIRFRALD
ncbi:glycoside hydrolase family 97 protein [Balneolales bacterium ANBcel1]|nr:glycoside hydrolase family 97 protein [Balneolales bacterium ANBcel1]